MITIEDFLFVFHAIHKILNTFVLRIFSHDYFASFLLRSIERCSPATVGNAKNSDCFVPLVLHLLYLVAHCINFGVHFPKIFNLFLSLLGEPYYLGNCNISSSLQKSAPLMQTFFETYIIYCAFTPN